MSSGIWEDVGIHRTRGYGDLWGRGMWQDVEIYGAGECGDLWGAGRSCG